MQNQIPWLLMGFMRRLADNLGSFLHDGCLMIFLRARIKYTYCYVSASQLDTISTRKESMPSALWQTYSPWKNDANLSAKLLMKLTMPIVDEMFNSMSHVGNMSEFSEYHGWFTFYPNFENSTESMFTTKLSAFGVTMLVYAHKQLLSGIPCAWMCWMTCFWEYICHDIFVTEYLTTADWNFEVKCGSGQQNPTNSSTVWMYSGVVHPSFVFTVVDTAKSILSSPTPS